MIIHCKDIFPFGFSVDSMTSHCKGILHPHVGLSSIIGYRCGECCIYYSKSEVTEYLCVRRDIKLNTILDETI